MPYITAKPKIAVLKFSDDVLTKTTEIPPAAHEIYQYLRAGYRVLAVVSAHDANLNCSELEQFSDENFIPPTAEVAELLASKEIAEACLFTIGLLRAGIKVKKLSHQCLLTKNSLLNSELDAFPTDLVISLFQRYSVIVIPGMVGSDHAKNISLLGRRGADYAAIYATWSLHADTCVIYKDTDGIYTQETQDTARHYNTISYSDLLKLPKTLIHHKAIKFAEAQKISFAVTSLTGINKTIVSQAPSTFSTPKPIKTVNVILLGLGTVGLGVYKHLMTNSHLFNVVGIGVINPKILEREHFSKHLCSEDWSTLLERPCDVVIELTENENDSAIIIKQALSQGCHVITANRSLIAKEGDKLNALAALHKVKLLYSACVGGSIPILETLKNLCGIQSISGVLNSTCNFILDKIKEGHTLQQSLSLIKLIGSAEHFDLYDTEVTQKAIILSHIAFGRDPDTIDTLGIQYLNETVIRETYEAGKNIRLVVNCTLKNQLITVKIEPVVIDLNHPLAHVGGLQNAILIYTNSHEVIELHGTSAGHWPIAESVFADLLDLCYQVNDRQLHVNQLTHNNLIHSEKRESLKKQSITS